MSQLPTQELVAYLDAICEVPSSFRWGMLRWRIDFYRHSSFLLRPCCHSALAQTPDHPTPARHHGGARARLRVLSRRGGRGDQRRLFSAAGGQACRLSLQSARRVQGRAPQISADELSAGFSARPVSASRWPNILPRCGRRSRRLRFLPSAATSWRAAKRWCRNGDPQRGVPACAGCHGPTLGGMEPAIPGLLGLRASYISAQLGGWRYGTRTAASPDCMQIIAGLLTEDDVKAVAAFLVVASRRRRTRRLRRAAACRCRLPAAASRTEGGDRAHAENLESTAPGSPRRVCLRSAPIAGERRRMRR